MIYTYPTSTQDLEYALLNGEIQAFFQPIVFPYLKNIMGVELLVRWNHPELGILMPKDFLSLFEQKNMMGELTKMLYEDGLYALRNWMDHHIFVRMHINIPKGIWKESSMLEFFIRYASIIGISTDMICFEYSQYELEQDPEITRKMLMKYHEEGFCLCVDDFCFDDSFFSWVSTGVFQTLKLSRAKVDMVLHHPELEGIVHDFIIKYKKHVQHVVGVGVENEHALKKMIELGCDSIQGHIYKPALSQEACFYWLNGFVEQSHSF
jgi:EAL domain-containing protein (putative c-di-GMP-specific phosphodiesterase class I)